ncbi:MAG: membrane dipeptidase [Deltaproteobacteria bacterium]|nr:membrane dipeptidase [Deltaproteobacteria bacterium]
MDESLIDSSDCLNPLNRRVFLVTLLAAIASVCVGPTVSGSLKREQALLAEAADITQRISIDLHSHPGPFAGRNAFSSAARDMPTVFADMKQGKLDAARFCFVADRPVIRRESGRIRQFRDPGPGELFRLAQSELDKVMKELEGMRALSAADVLAFKQKGVPCGIVGFEGADALEGDLSRLQLFYDRGIRVIQLVHYRINELGDIQTEPPRHGGLTTFGRDVVKGMNRLGMMIDVAHASSETIRGVLAETRHPVLDSHTRPSARLALSRARSDDDLRAVAKKGGVIGVWPIARKARGETFDDFVKDIDYVKSLVGVDHVGIGTDLNGLGQDTVVPTHKEFSLIPAGLLARGFSESEVTRIIGENFMRVFREVTENRG